MFDLIKVGTMRSHAITSSALQVLLSNTHHQDPGDRTQLQHDPNSAKTTHTANTPTAEEEEAEEEARADHQQTEFRPKYW